MFSLIRFALILLEAHNHCNRYVDDFPSARHEAGEHRAQCEICKHIDANRDTFRIALMAYNVPTR